MITFAYGIVFAALIGVLGAQHDSQFKAAVALAAGVLLYLIGFGTAIEVLT